MDERARRRSVDTMRRSRTSAWTRRRVIGFTALGVVALFVLVQAVPYGRAHTNPPVRQEPRWDSPQTRAFAQRACFDCHSNETKWRWYTNVAPVSWLVQRDVDGGRSALDFSEWNRPQDVSAADIADSVRGGSMPPWFYAIVHPSASLSNGEQAQFIRGLDATFAASPPLGGGG
jgi:cytochrome c551/c552